ncbi:MAG: type 1 glutamine amidotransferase [Actinomycetota bacterium]|nr:type 1 glutamine amidotransferase [Actinomycetota bacterium]
MTTIDVITHVDRAVVGLVDEVAGDRGHECRVVRPYRGERLPGLDEVGTVVVLGGPQSAYEDHTYLADEERFLAGAVDAGVPVFAICLGSQVLSRALGGSAHPGETGLEAGIIEVKACVSGSAGIAGEFFSFHSDSMTPPAGARVLAESDRYVQAWTLGSALAVQFHPELTLAGVNGLLGLEGPKLERFGVDVAAMRADAERYFAAGAADARALLDRWFDELA